MSEGVIIAIISGSITIILAIIGLILASLKLAKKKDTENIFNKNKEIITQIGEDKNTSLVRDHQDIIKKIESNLENKDSFILSKLEKVDKFVTKEEFRNEILGDEKNYFKILEENRTRDKLKISLLEKENTNLKKEILLLEKKLNSKNLDKDKDREF